MAKIVRTTGMSDTEGRRLRAESHRTGAGVRRIAHGMYAVEADHTDLDRLATRARAALLFAPSGSLVCGATALALAGVRLPQRVARMAAGPVHVAVPREVGWHSRRPEVVSARPQVMPPQGPINSFHVPVAHMPYCWVRVTVDLMRGPGWDPRHADRVPTSPGIFAEPRKAAFLESVQVGDQLVTRTNPVIAYEQFAEYITTLAAARGAPLARSVFTHVRPNTDSTMESWLRLVVWDAGFPDPVVNHRVNAAGKTRILDLAWPELMIDLEFHGRQHFHESERAYDDVRRRGQLQLAGWTTIEVVENDLISPGRLLQRLDALFTARRAIR
ncbi:MAG: hypothetical protein LBK72_00390 [Bifidobacteriaceae bacterium]|jgi:hypothetical protein|nr:hypothetical protein [Bifidobacteriaceae bacterium]